MYTCVRVLSRVGVLCGKAAIAFGYVLITPKPYRDSTSGEYSLSVHFRIHALARACAQIVHVYTHPYTHACMALLGRGGNCGANT